MSLPQLPPVPPPPPSPAQIEDTQAQIKKIQETINELEKQKAALQQKLGSSQASEIKEKNAAKPDTKKKTSKTPKKRRLSATAIADDEEVVQFNTDVQQQPQRSGEQFLDDQKHQKKKQKTIDGAKPGSEMTTSFFSDDDNNRNDGETSSDDHANKTKTSSFNLGHALTTVKEVRDRLLQRFVSLDKEMVSQPDQKTPASWSAPPSLQPMKTSHVSFCFRLSIF